MTLIGCRTGMKEWRERECERGEREERGERRERERREREREGLLTIRE
jgi:hypothetical protein